MSKQLYSELTFAIDLVAFEYQTNNPVIITEKIEQDLGLEYSIHQVADHLDINKMEDFEKESYKIYNY